LLYTVAGSLAVKGKENEWKQPKDHGFVPLPGQKSLCWFEHPQV